MFDAMAQMVHRYQGHCPELGRALFAIVERHELAITAGKRLHRDSAVRPRIDAWMTKHRPRIKASDQTVKVALRACAGTPEFRELVLRMQAM